MGVDRRSTIGGTLTLLGLAVALTVGTWLVMGSEPRLGPHDGLDLLGIDTGRVAGQLCAAKILADPGHLFDRPFHVHADFAPPSPSIAANRCEFDR